MKKLILIYLLLLTGIVWAADRSPSCNVATYICDGDGQLDETYCDDMIEVNDSTMVEFYIGFADGSQDSDTSTWYDKIYDHNSASRVFIYTTLKGIWSDSHPSGAESQTKGTQTLHPGGALYDAITAMFTADSLAKKYEQLFEHYEDPVVFNAALDGGHCGSNYLFAPGVTNGDYMSTPAIVDAEDSINRVIYYCETGAYDAGHDTTISGETCYWTTGEDRCLLAMDEEWKRQVVASAYARYTWETTDYYWAVDRKYGNLYMDNCDAGNSRVFGTTIDALGTTAVSYEAGDSSDITRNSMSADWAIWKHHMMLAQIALIQDSVQAHTAWGMVAINTVWDVDWDWYDDYDNIAIDGIVLLAERRGSWGYNPGSGFGNAERTPTGQFAEFENLWDNNNTVVLDAFTTETGGDTVHVNGGTTYRDASMMSMNFLDAIEMTHYHHMGLYYLLKPQDDADSLFQWSFNKGSCTSCEPGGGWVDYHWVRALNVDIGDPDSACWLEYEGKATDEGSYDVEVYRRDYTEGANNYTVVSRVAMYGWWGQDDEFGNSNYYTYNPGDIGDFWVLRADGTWSSSMSSIDLYAVTSAIITDSDPGGGSDTFEINSSTSTSIGAVDHEEKGTIPGYVGINDFSPRARRLDCRLE